MNRTTWIGWSLVGLVLCGCSERPSQERQTPMETTPPLSAEENRVIWDKGTEAAFTGTYWDHFANGYYACRACDALLYRSDDKFRSGCGWPSFDEELPEAVKRQPDADGRRTEIICASCGGHLGHVFLGEKMTDKNTRHCVNSVSIVFKTAAEAKVGRAIFAGGCFWGVEHLFAKQPGVISSVSGYTGGSVKDPTYTQVCTGDTGHAEAVEVLFDPKKTNYERLATYFFEIHDPTQLNRQGPDKGTQYRSALFVSDAAQRATAKKLIESIRVQGYPIVTEVAGAVEFYRAEESHQDYFSKAGREATCHLRNWRKSK